MVLPPGLPAARLFLEGYGCAESVLLGLGDAGALEVPDDLVRSSIALASGGGEPGEMCGALVAGILALGLQHGRVGRSDSRQHAVERAAELRRRFRARFGAISCDELRRGAIGAPCGQRKLHCARVVAFVTDAVACELAERRPDRTGPADKPLVGWS
ncbi:MAG: C-GCAxxG-C-C family protein [Candidatus Rokubacteria bacterium]|nr:C-GCAxxG-C-C family protein [Candidatus Rokubacteria bacterium]